jgi:two-component system, NarL family, invasion response regulator UvrY
MKSRLIIADDHQVVRQGLRDMIERCPDLEVVAEASDGEEAETLARRVTAELLILDIAMPIRRGIEVLETLRADGIKLPILFFSMYPASQYVEYAKMAGAQGFVSKDADMATLLDAIRRILAGGTAFAGDMTNVQKAVPKDDIFATLSRREIEVLHGLIRGTAIHDIASGLGIRPQTATTYRRRLLEKLSVHSNAELVILATQHGYF